MRESVYMLTLIDQLDTLRTVGTLGPVGTVRAIGILKFILTNYGGELGMDVPFERRTRIRCLHFQLGK